MSIYYFAYFVKNTAYSGDKQQGTDKNDVTELRMSAMAGKNKNKQLKCSK